MARLPVGFAIFLIAVGITAMVFPVLHYLRVGWHAKRRDIMSGFNPEARIAYRERFCRDLPGSLKPRKSGTAENEFEDMYTKWYGRRFYVLPTFLLTLVTATAVTLVVLTVLHERRFLAANPLIDLQPTTIAALAGAYLWVLNDFLTRARRMDFHPSDVNWGVLRLIVAVPMGYAFASLLTPGLAPFIAFALGAFPITALIGLLRRIASQKAGLGSTKDEAESEIVKLQGVNKAIVERLAMEDITTITQVAYCDPVQLIMRSSLTFDYVTDCMNQALAWMYLKEGVTRLCPLGLRGAVEIRHFVSELDDIHADQPDRKAANARAIAALPKYAEALRQAPETLQVVLREIAGDPYTMFLEKVW